MSWNRAATGQAHAMGIEYLDGLYSYVLVLGNSVSTSFRGSSSMISVACGIVCNVAWNDIIAQIRSN